MQLAFAVGFPAFPRGRTPFLIPAQSSLDGLIERMWEELSLVKVYTKKRGAHPDLDDPVCLRKGATIEVRTVIYDHTFPSLPGFNFTLQTVCNTIHRSLAPNFRYGLVW
jgi:ribosome-interacting GTPase 1